MKGQLGLSELHVRYIVGVRYSGMATVCLGNDDAKFSDLANSHAGIFMNASGKCYSLYIRLNLRYATPFFVGTQVT